MGAVTAAVVREPFDQMRGLLTVKTSLEALEHQVTDHFAGNTTGRGDLGITSRSQVSSAKATRTLWPFQHATSKPSEVHLRFGRIVMI